MTDWPELQGDAGDVAPRLLGWVIRTGGVAVRITEVEAYAGASDPGSHAFRGPTPRTKVMFGPAGYLYCYLSYGMHVCANVVVGVEGSAAAVLLRAGAVIDGIDLAVARRPGMPVERMARGPALLSRTLDIGLDDDGADLSCGPIRLERGPAPASVSSGPRVGLRSASDRRWRFWTSGDPSVSAYRRHPRADREDPDL